MMAYASPPARDNFRAAGLMCITMALFATNDMIVKLLLGTLPPGQVMGLRNLVIIALLVAFVVLRRRRLVWSQVLDRIALARGIIEVAITYCFFVSLQLMPLADATVLVFSAPIIMTVGVALSSIEKVGPRRWIAVVAGFAGVVMVAGPGNAALGPAALLPLFAACLVAMRDIITRYVPKTHDSTAVALTTAAAVAIGGCLSLPLGAIGMVQPWVLPSLAGWSLILATAILAGTAYTTLVASFRMGEASLLAPFRYLAIPIAVALSWGVFGDVPSLAMLVGAAVIMASGIFIFARERQLAKQPRLAERT